LTAGTTGETLIEQIAAVGETGRVGDLPRGGATLA
jgi:hypothetical protein